MSFQFLEQPIRTSTIAGLKVVVLGAVCVAIPLAAAVGLKVHADALTRSAASAVVNVSREVGVRPPSTPPSDDLLQSALLAQRGQWEVYDEPCLGNESDAPGTCVFFEGGGKPRAVIIGDSHAGAHSPGFLAAANSLGYSAEVITSPGCPFAAVPIAHSGVINDGCVKRTEEIKQYLADDPPEVVVIANRSPRFVNPEVLLADELDPSMDPTCVADPTSGDCLSHDDAVKEWADAFRSTATEIENLGTTIMLLQTVPEQEHGLERCVRGTRVDLDCLQTPRALTSERRQDVISAEAAVADDLGLAYWDPIDSFCDDTTCYQYLDGQFRYRNDDHLNYLGSEWTTDDLIDLLRTVPLPTSTPTPTPSLPGPQSAR